MREIRPLREFRETNVSSEKKETTYIKEQEEESTQHILPNLQGVILFRNVIFSFFF